MNRPAVCPVKPRIYRRYWWMLLILLLIPGWAGAVEFTAQMVVKDGDKTMPGRIFFQNGKMRQEFVDEEGRTITIVRPDKKVIWVIMPQEKTYLEMPLRTRLPGQFIQIPPDAISKRVVGTETVNGYVADRYEVTLKGGDTGVMKQTVWVAKKLQVAIKMVTAQRNFSIEYRNIREGGLAALLFEPPKGFVKTTSPTTFTVKMMEEME